MLSADMDVSRPRGKVMQVLMRVVVVMWLGLFGLTSTVFADSVDGEAEEDFQLPLPLDDNPLLEDRAPLWNFMDPKLQKNLEKSIRDLGLGRPVQYRKLAIALVDITHIDHPRVAELNGDEMMYAASLPKIAILLAVFEKLDQDGRPLDKKIEEQLINMIRKSSNSDATALMKWVGKEFIARVLVSYRYRLYDPLRNGGLWVGKDFGKAGSWRRDPINNISHGATAIQVARFYYLLEMGQLINKKISLKIKEILGNSAISHKFKLGLQQVRPTAKIYRKSGTWKHFHADSAIVERDGVRYIAVALAENPQGGKWLKQLIVAMDRLVDP